MLNQNSKLQDSNEECPINLGKPKAALESQILEDVEVRGTQVLQEPLLDTIKTRQLAVRVKPQTVLYEVYVEGGGTPPVELSGIYTNQTKARLAIEAYRASQAFIEANKRPYHKSRLNGGKNQTRD